MASRGSSAGAATGPSVQAFLARLLLTREIGQRIPPVQELQASMGTGAGTAVKGLRALEAGGAVSLSARGHKGTVVVARHVGRLWNESGLGSVRLAMPPPGPVEQLGIVRGIQEALDRIGVPVVVDFISGARRRLEEVYHERAHVAIASSGAYGRHASELRGLTSLDLGESTYYADGSLVVVERAAPHPPRRVGIDRDSYDHEQLTLREFGAHDVEYVEFPFVRAPAWVLAGKVDAAVWHQMPTVIPPELAGLCLRPLTTPDATTLLNRISHASLVTRALDAATNAVLREVRIPNIIRIQEHLRASAAQDDDVFGPVLWPR